MHARFISSEVAAVSIYVLRRSTLVRLLAVWRRVLLGRWANHCWGLVLSRRCRAAWCGLEGPCELERVSTFHYVKTTRSVRLAGRGDKSTDTVWELAQYRRE